MSMASNSNATEKQTPLTISQQPHMVVCPSSGMGHLAPFLRLTSLLDSSCNSTVTLVIMLPTISTAESNQITNFFTTHPQVNRHDFHIPITPSCTTTTTTTNTTTYDDDPFFLQYKAICSSAHLLLPQLVALNPPVSAIFSDLLVTKAINNDVLNMIPNYTVTTTSARFFSLMANLPRLLSTQELYTSHEVLEISGIDPFPKDTIPPPFYNKNHTLTQAIVSNAEFYHLSKGIILNTYDFLEMETITALNQGKVLTNLPPIYPIGPYPPVGMTGLSLPWLDHQPPRSVVFVSFGSRTAMTRNQIREIGTGLDRSGYRFLWVVKTTKVDKDDTQDLKEILGDEFFNNTKDRGVVLKEWVLQEDILAHPSTGGFVSHGGWNSVTEAAYNGMPMLVWPQHGDQKMSATVVEKAGLGIWERGWGWGGERIVTGDEILEKINEMMGNQELRISAGRVRDEARKAWEVGGSSKERLMQIITDLL